MSFKNNMGGVRAWGRKQVLPVDTIKEMLITEIFDKYNVDKVVDFGAGTLYWSNWLQQIIGKNNIYPVDIIFKDVIPDTFMHYFSSIDEISLEDGLNLFFTCDVLHHLSSEDWGGYKQIIFNNYDIVVIKDINCHYRFKNWMNRMHDRIINGEHIHDVDPEALLAELHENGYQCIYRNIHKLWYSHFIIIAIRK